MRRECVCPYNTHFQTDRSWQGAYFMADWAKNHADVFAGKRVIELGSGTGLLGISLLKAQLGMRSYTLTDCHHKVINALLCNLRINFPASESRDEVCLQRCCERGPPEEYHHGTMMDSNYTKVRGRKCVNKIAICVLRDNPCPRLYARHKSK